MTSPLHKNGDVLTEMTEVINRTAARGGVVLIPAFAVGRAQSLMYCTHLLKSPHAIANRLHEQSDGGKRHERLCTTPG